MSSRFRFWLVIAYIIITAQIISTGAFSPSLSRFMLSSTILGKQPVAFFPEASRSLFSTIMKSSKSEVGLGEERPERKTVKSPSQPQPSKVHTVTVCAVPPHNTNGPLWGALSEMRLELKDPGYYRWPPHVNLLYPFLKLPKTDGTSASDSDNETNSVPYHSVQEIVEQLESATRKIPPFVVKLDTLGTFGGKKRGVLWLHPDSNREADTESSSSPMVDLQGYLEEAFPMCKDQSQKGGSFTPHMTLSHFPCLESALEAKEHLEGLFPCLGEETKDALHFLLDRIYLLERKGNGGQFLRVAEIALGDEQITRTRIFDPPSPFPTMPVEEAEWVHEERMLLKSRRNKNGRGRGGRNKGRRRTQRGPRVPDTPEVIAQKRAERKAKRERLLLEQQQGTTPAPTEDGGSE